MMKPEVNLDHLLHEMDFRTGDKLCPLPLMSGNPPVPCLGHKCAKWNPHYGGCCDGTLYLTMDATLDNVGRQLSRLCDLMQKKEA